MSTPDEWASIFDIHFTPVDHCFHAIVELPVPALGLSFVIQTSDGAWLKNRAQDFYIGGGRRPSAAHVEVPILWPCAETVFKQRLVSMHRRNPFWMVPHFPTALHDCKEDTQFVVLQLDTGDLSQSYAALLPVIDRAKGIRASLFGVPGSRYAAIRLENGGCGGIEWRCIQECMVAVASMGEPDVYDTIQHVVETAVHHVGGFSSTSQKVASPDWRNFTGSQDQPVANMLGYCTWDSFSHEVSESAVHDALKWLRDATNVPIGYAVIDDGWQDGGGDGPNFTFEAEGCDPKRPALISYGANDKFSQGSLWSLSKNNPDVVIYAWTSIIGYWGGASRAKCDVPSTAIHGVLSVAMRRHDPVDSAQWEKDFEVIVQSEQSVFQFFTRYFEDNMARKGGVGGAKVDSQSVLELLCNLKETTHGPTLSRVSLSAIYRKAMAAAAEQAFGQRLVINCMACGNDTLFSSGEQLSPANLMWRTSNDHAFPNIHESAESVAWHILQNAVNSMFIGAIIPLPDWDMFRANDEHATMHAYSRVISGGAVYISDTTPFEGPLAEASVSLLRRLVTVDGRILRCVYAGRPTVDCMWRDPRQDPVSLYQVWNRSAVNGLVAVFNLQGRSNIQGSFVPCDVADFEKSPGRCGYVSWAIYGSGIVKEVAFLHEHGKSPGTVQLPGMSPCLIHVCPMFDIGHKMQFAAVGQRRLLNCGASIASVSWTTASRAVLVTRVEVCLRDDGETIIWLNEHANEHLHAVYVGNRASIVPRRHIYLDSVRFLSVNVVGNDREPTLVMDFKL